MNTETKLKAQLKKWESRYQAAYQDLKNLTHTKSASKRLAKLEHRVFKLQDDLCIERELSVNH